MTEGELSEIEKENINKEETLDEVESTEKDPENRNEVEIMGKKQDEIEEKEPQDDGEEKSKENGNDEADPENIEFM